MARLNILLGLGRGWRGGDEGMEEVTAVTSYFVLQMDVGGHLFRSRIFMYLVIISFRRSVLWIFIYLLTFM